ncbi:hypothetical protein BSL82_03820 [Tardibacter chloracetimidivorans]|uniref:SPOR domain-containing protein n=1 Tax=Tardibacter chloracetimidivorans TaxID=1921510 RepID=A0A1L3ZSE5_9SPHN|nr:hypothetical protein [Tardibacter chloracetimidivorans]API58545.1 hypothetical protein BSL82_03820 [Tardibacter chloracetimidivorans]
MFLREPWKPPPGATSSYEVRYQRGRKPFATLAEARAFAVEQRALEEGWASINQIFSIEIEKKS